jgi:hypothetical protein
MKKDQWIPWVKFFEEECTSEGKIRKWLNKTPKDYRLLVALALSVAHWHPKAAASGGWSDDCALCIFSGYASMPLPNKCDCSKCPVSKSPLQDCRDEKSVWKQWMRTIDEGSVSGRMFRGLKKLYFAEYNKVMG